MSFNPKPGGDVKDYFAGNAVIVHSKAEDYWWGLSIINDGAGDLIFTVNNVRITVASGEAFSDNFADFNSISIDTAMAYRLVLRG